MIYRVFLRNLLLTVAVEGTAMALIMRRRRDVYVCVLVNVLTNPVLNLALLILAGRFAMPYWPVLAVLEMLAVLVEAWQYRALCQRVKGRTGPALGLSLLLNGLSLGLGLAIG